MLQARTWFCFAFCAKDVSRDKGHNTEELRLSLFPVALSTGFLARFEHPARSVALCVAQCLCERLKNKDQLCGPLLSTSSTYVFSE